MITKEEKNFFSLISKSSDLPYVQGTKQRIMTNKKRKQCFSLWQEEKKAQPQFTKKQTS